MLGFNNIKSMPKRSTGFAALGILAVVLVALTVVAGVAWIIGIVFLPLPPHQVPQGLPPTIVTTRISGVPTLNPMADWKTYTDSEIGFKFKYPTNRFVQQSPREAGEFITIESDNLLELISIYISSDPIIVNNFGRKNSNGGPLSNLEKVQIDNRDGIKYRAKVNTETNQAVAVTIQVIKDKYSIELVYFQVNEQSDTTFNQILSTFKFLD